MDNRTIEQVRENEDSLIKEIDKLEEKLKRAKEVINGMIDNEEKYCLEIDRLNNIINELERYIIENSFGSPLHNCSVIESYKVLDKLQELKGSDKNEK